MQCGAQWQECRRSVTLCSAPLEGSWSTRPGLADQEWPSTGELLAVGSIVWCLDSIHSDLKEEAVSTATSKKRQLLGRWKSFKVKGQSNFLNVSTNRTLPVFSLHTFWNVVRTTSLSWQNPKSLFLDFLMKMLVYESDIVTELILFSGCVVSWILLEGSACIAFNTFISSVPRPNMATQDLGTRWLIYFWYKYPIWWQLKNLRGDTAPLVVQLDWNSATFHRATHSDQKNHHPFNVCQVCEICEELLTFYHVLGVRELSCSHTSLI